MEAYSLLVLGIFVELLALGCSCPTEEFDLVGNATLTCFDNDSCEARCYDDYIFPTGYATIKFSCQDGQWTPNITSCKVRGWSCYREELDLMENAHLIYLTNDLCEAQCYRGYIFPTGYTKANFSCYDGQWTPRTSSCKRVPVTGFQLETVLRYTVDPYQCNTLRTLNYVGNRLEYAWRYCCGNRNMDFTLHSYYEMRGNQPSKDSYYYVNVGYLAEFTNYTSNYTLSSCLSRLWYKTYLELSDHNKYDAVCENKSARVYISFVSKYPETKYQYCPQGFEVKNITFIEPRENPHKRIEFFCDCPREELDRVENAHLACLTDYFCKAECYRGYIFPTGYTKANFTCQDGQWTPSTNPCVPVAIVQYEANLGFNVDPYRCNVTSTWLDAFTKRYEEPWEECSYYNMSLTVSSYNVPAKKHYDRKSYYYVNMGYLAQFNNYTSNQSLNSCFNYVYRRYIIYRFGTNINILENMICENKSLSFRYLYIPLEFHIIHRRCPRGMQVNNVTLNATYYYREKHLECFCDNIISHNVTDNVTDDNGTTASPADFNVRPAIKSYKALYVQIVTYVVPSVIGIIIVALVVIFVVRKRRKIPTMVKKEHTFKELDATPLEQNLILK
uniref:Uncharacterized protein LOC111101381 isoform X2 n=1 Tax=Crassostrea virginica TaxID=6565 RepID=A0A8B8AHS9_CRAVI|nr:uncharacterized protein LOC111101381 isoform X2 [Crassostrea virginica]